MAHHLKERYEKEVIPAWMKEFGLKNRMQVPRVEKIVINGLVERLHARGEADLPQRPALLHRPRDVRWRTKEPGWESFDRARAPRAERSGNSSTGRADFRSLPNKHGFVPAGASVRSLLRAVQVRQGGYRSCSFPAVSRAKSGWA